MKRTVLLLMGLLLIVFGTSVYAGGQKEGAEVEKTYNWRIATEELEGDWETVWAQKFAEEMNEWSDGRINITVYPFGTLGTLRDVTEQCQNGAIEFVTGSHGWLSNFVPQVQVFLLHYLLPEERPEAILDEITRNGEAFKMLEEKFREKNFQPLAIMLEGWMWITSREPIRDIDDMEGLKLRLMKSPILVENYKAYGANPVTMDFGDVYNGLQLGTIDAQVNPIFLNYSMKFYEVQDYYAQPWAETYVVIPCANKDFFDGLPKDIQDKIRQTWVDYIIPAGVWGWENDLEKKEMTLEDRPEIEFYEFTDAQKKEAKRLAMRVYDMYRKTGGEDAALILQTLIEDIEKAKNKLGIE